MSTKESQYERITHSIIADLAQGVAPWVKPWRSGAPVSMPVNAVTARPYSGVNVLTLWDVALRRGYPAPRWLTYRQAQERHGHVRKGERGTTVFFVRSIPREDEEGVVTRRRSLLRSYTVFNVAQCEGLPAHLQEVSVPGAQEERHGAADAFLAAAAAEVRHGGDRAYYSPSQDVICLPPFGAFESSGHYYATSLHEHVHWAGSEKRLSREFGKRFGDRSYAAEELVAELGAAFLCAHLGIEGKLRHAEYIGSWITLLNDDSRAIFTAASKASQAADFLRAFSLGCPVDEDGPG